MRAIFFFHSILLFHHSLASHYHFLCSTEAIQSLWSFDCTSESNNYFHFYFLKNKSIHYLIPSVVQTCENFHLLVWINVLVSFLSNIFFLFTAYVIYHENGFHVFDIYYENGYHVLCYLSWKWFSCVCAIYDAGDYQQYLFQYSPIFTTTNITTHFTRVCCVQSSNYSQSQTYHFWLWFWFLYKIDTYFQ